MPDSTSSAAATTPATQAAPAPGTELTVVCGDVSFAVYPVLLGHFAGDAISGVEKRLDESLQNQLTRRHRLGVYPSMVGSAFVVRNEADQKPAGVVVGLGDVASFTVATIRTAMIAGLSELALAGPSDNDGSVAIIPLGVGKGAVSLGSALAAILSATADAQHRLTSQGFRRFAKVNIIDQMEDEAHSMWHALRLLIDGTSLANEFALQPRIDYKDGWARQIGKGVSSDSWRAVQITDAGLPAGAPGLRFTSIGDMARAEGFISGDSRTIMTSLMKSAIAGPGAVGAGVSPGRALFELTWPDALKRDSRTDLPTRLILDDVAAHLPFELMDDRRLDADPQLKPPAVRHGLLRQLIQQSFAPDRNRAFGAPSALVIGDPRAAWNATPPNPAASDLRPQFPPLAGAQAEATMVADMLETEWNFDVKRLIGDAATPELVIEHLLRGNWTILHVAAHGMYDNVFQSDWVAGGRPAYDSAAFAALPHYTGVVLGDRLVLGDSILQSMPDAPSLAFINCCDLGSIEDEDEVRARLANSPEFAASFAAQMMAIGADAVIAAGWEVSDAGAVTFAQNLYQQMLKGGAGFGDAVKFARLAVYEGNPVNTTWGAYQCYGEPDWRLIRPGGLDSASDPDDSAPAPAYASPAELVAELESVTSQASVGAGRVDRRASLVARLAAAEKTAADTGWIDEPHVAEAIGFTHSALGDQAQAITAFEACLAANAEPSVRMLEQLASLRIKQAAANATQTGPQAALQAIDAARQDLERINQLAGETGERLSLIAGAAKRQAQLAQGEARSQALDKMYAAYLRARDVAEAQQAPDAYYPAFMAANAVILQRLRKGGAAEPAEADLLADLQAQLAPLAGGAPDYWLDATVAGAVMLARLTAGELTDEAAADVANAYNTAWTRSGDKHALDATTEHMQFLVEVLDGCDAATAAKAWVAKVAAGLSEAA
jgi:hypothetical protein